MRVGIAVSFTNGFGEKGQYHSQELGLAKQFAKNGHIVQIYKAVVDGCSRIEVIQDSITIKYCQVKSLGAQGLLRPSTFSTELDVLIYFSDTQFSLNSIDTWCRRNKVISFYYVGSIESNSDNSVIKLMMDLHFRIRTLPVYRKRGVVAKTPYIMKKLQALGVSKVELAPVGIDFDLMDISNVGFHVKDYPFVASGRLLLFVGRLERYKYPMNALDLLSMLPSDFKLLVIGKGSMETELKEYASQIGISSRVSWISSVPNDQMAAHYYAADYFINVNPEEIFGMAVVEAVYHGCRTIALSAPGPDYILSGMKSHKTVVSLREMAQELSMQIEYDDQIMAEDKRTLIERCSWKSFVSLVESGCSDCE